MLFYDGRRMVSQPDTVRVLKEVEQPKPILPQVSQVSVANALNNLLPRTISWGLNSSVDGD